MLFKKHKDARFIPPQIIGRKIVKRYNKKAKEYYYALVIFEEYTPHVRVQRRFLGHWFGPAWYENGTPMVFPSTANVGDLDWAIRIAKKYKLEIEDDKGN